MTLMALMGKPVLYSLKDQSKTHLDIAFPILHGTMGEDGTIQGLFKMVQLPFVGCGVWSSAAGMDKEVMKRLFTEAQIPNAKYLFVNSVQSHLFTLKSRRNWVLHFLSSLANAGSSVGVHKIKSADDYEKKLKDSFQFDSKVLAEEFHSRKRAECSVMGHKPCTFGFVAWGDHSTTRVLFLRSQVCR